MEWTALNIEAFAPMPSASARTITAVETGLFLNSRYAYTKSRNMMSHRSSYRSSPGGALDFGKQIRRSARQVFELFIIGTDCPASHVGCGVNNN